MRRRGSLFGLLLVLLGAPAWAALSVDVASNGGVNNNVTSVSWTHTAAATAKALVVIPEVKDTDDATRNISDVQYAGASITAAVTYVDNAAENIQLDVWYKLTPATGAQTVTVTGTGGGGSADILSGQAITLIDDVGTPTYDTSGSSSSSGTTPTQALTIANNALMVAGLFTSAGVPGNVSVTTGTEQDELDLGPAVVSLASRGPLTPGGSYSIVWDTPNVVYITGGISFAPATTGAGCSRFLLLGVGC